MQTLRQAMQSQMQIAHPINHNNLANYNRSKLEMYMIDCQGFDTEQLTEWETTEDLRCDIRAFGWEKECLEYLA